MFVFHCIHIVYRPIVKTISHLQGHSTALDSTSLHVHLLNSLKSQLSLNDRTPHDAKTMYQAMITNGSQTADATPVTAATHNVCSRFVTRRKRNAMLLVCHAIHSITYTSSLMIPILFTAFWCTQTFPSYVTIRLSRIILQSPLFRYGF